jgi:hypothetical protein
MSLDPVLVNRCVILLVMVVFVVVTCHMIRHHSRHKGEGDE